MGERQKMESGYENSGRGKQNAKEERIAESYRAYDGGNKLSPKTDPISSE